MKYLALLMVCVLLISSTCLIAQSAKAEDKVIVWAVKDSPVYLNSNITIAAGETLRIEPGVQVICKTYNWRISVYGRLEAVGTQDARISFKGTYDISNQWDGVYLYSDGNVMEHCELSNCVYGVWSDGDAQAIIDCNFTRCNVGAYLKGDGNAIRDCRFKDMVFLGLSLWGSKNSVTNSSFDNCLDAGVFMRDNELNLISKCVFTRSEPGFTLWNGVRLFHSSKNQLSNCSFDHIYYGVNLESGSNDNNIADNAFLNCTFGNILFSFDEGEGGAANSDRNVLAYNHYDGNYNGLVISGKDNRVTGNDIAGSTNYGIYFFNDSTAGNTVWLNNFKDNTNDLFDLSGNNSYNNAAKEGNYWSKSNLTDKDHNGIGDSAYGLDRYPLMDPLVFEDGRLEDYDTDGDGLKDYRDPDDDNDKFSDIEERQSGYDPKDAESHPPKDPYTLEAYVVVALFALLIVATIGVFVFFSRRKGP